MMSTITLQNGAFHGRDGFVLPAVGLGTYSLHGADCVRAVAQAVALGYRYIDTATFYGNEQEVGRGVRSSGVPRSEIQVATKLYPHEYAYAQTAIDECLRRLDLEYIDVLLLHHPAHNDAAAYRAIEQAVSAGKVRYAAISCYYISEIERFLPQVRLWPALVQNEVHPYYQDTEVVSFLQNKGLIVQAWYPLGGRGYTHSLLADPVIREIAAQTGRTPAQIVLRWNVQHNVAVIPGSSSSEHLKQNLEVTEFELTAEQMQAIDQLERSEKHDWY